MGINTDNNPVVPMGREREQLESLIRQLLIQIGEDPQREGLVQTPARVAEAWAGFTAGYNEDADAIVSGGVFDDEHDGLVVVRDIEFFSMCEHHLVPFFGKCHIGYIPSGKIIGLSKFARVVEVFARRLQVQERMTQQIADALDQNLVPEGLGVVVEAQHLCMMMRGVKCTNSSAITSVMRGTLKSDPAHVTEFYHQIGRPQDD